MRAILERMLVALLLMFATEGGRALAQTTAPAASSRIALVIGIGSYRSAMLPTAANDAGLVAQTLAAAGFDVTGARDLDGDTLRRIFREFLGKASMVGPRGIAFVYFAGRALQFDGDNYLVPVDAAVGREADVPIETVRLADFTRALAALPSAAKVVVIDGAYAQEGASGSYANGLALVDPEPGSLIAFNAAPGTTAQVSADAYGTYAKILTQTMKQGGVPVEEVFDRVRVAVNTETRGAVVPWDVSKLAQSFQFFDRAPDAPAMGSAQIPFASLRSRPLRDFSPEQAYDVALARDTLPAYQEYLTVFPDSSLARRVRILLAARREALFWREALNSNSPPAFWTYLRRYSKGPHSTEAQRRLARLAAAKAPPPDFAPLAFDVPPPPEAEYPLIERPFLLDDPELEPPPPPPIFLLPPPPPEIVILPPPAPAPARGFLPIPVPVPIPFVRAFVAPGTIVPPRGFKGTYPQPRPFAAAPANGGLVVQPIKGPPPGRPTLMPRPAGVAPNQSPDVRQPVQIRPSLAPLPLPDQNGASLSRGRGSTLPAGIPPGQPATSPVQNGLPGAVPVDRRFGKPPHGPARLPGPDGKIVAPAPTVPLAPSQPAPQAPGVVPQPNAGASQPRGLPEGPTDRHRKQRGIGPGGVAPVPAAPAPGVDQPATPAPITQAPAQRRIPTANPLPAPGGGAGPAPGQGESRRRRIEPDGSAPASNLPGGVRLQPPNALGGQPPRLAPEGRPALEPRPLEPRPRPQPPSAFPPGGLQGGPPQGPGAGGDNRNRRPECGHPGQPPCRQ